MPIRLRPSHPSACVTVSSVEQLSIRYASTPCSSRCARQPLMKSCSLYAARTATTRNSRSPPMTSRNRICWSQVYSRRLCSSFRVRSGKFAIAGQLSWVVGGARRVLRPGGLLLISSPNRGVYPTGNPLHLRELTSSELEEKLSARFKRVAIHRQQTYFASLLAATGTLADNDPSNSMDVEVGKLTNDPAGSEL